MSIDSVTSSLHGNSSDAPTIIIGAGLAGLTCARRLLEADRTFLILEATDRVGGRVRTDTVDGFQLDHGFQVLLTAYPACKRWLDYDALQLRSFRPGAMVRIGSRFTTLGDPWRDPGSILQTAMSPVGTLGDKLRIAKLRRQSQAGTLNELYAGQADSTKARLNELGFSDSMITNFFRPFLGGVFLDGTLATSSRMLHFVFRMFAGGDIAVPAKGMSAIPQQLAARIPSESLRLSCSVQRVSQGRVELTDGTSLDASNIVVATESDAAARLLGLDSLKTPWGQTTTFYYCTDKVAPECRYLMLGGDESGPVQTVVVLSDVAPEYAPPGKSLVSVSVGDTHPADSDKENWDRVDSQIRDQLFHWFGDAVRSWRRLCVYPVPYGLPRTGLDPVVRPVQASSEGGPEQVYLCGDYRETPSIHGAMNSGQRAAEAILNA